LVVVAASLDAADVRVMQVRSTGREWVLTNVDPT
jgi:hypothetical protein